MANKRSVTGREPGLHAAPSKEHWDESWKSWVVRQTEPRPEGPHDSDTGGLVRSRPMAIDLETSWKAAEKAQRAAPILQRELFALLCRRPCIDEHLVEAYAAHRLLNPDLPDVSDQAIRSARARLMQRGWVVDTRRRGLTARGNEAVIWAARSKEETPSAN